MKKQMYFNNPKMQVQRKKVANRRDADNLITAAHKLNVLLFLTVLHDKYGFGKKRCEDVMSYVNDLLDSYNQNYISIYDLDSTLEEETGIKVL